MSRTNIHTEKGKSRNVKGHKRSLAFTKQIDRHNLDIAIDRVGKRAKIEKQRDKELKEEVKQYKFRRVTKEEQEEWRIDSYEQIL